MFSCFISLMFYYHTAFLLSCFNDLMNSLSDILSSNYEQTIENINKFGPIKPIVENQPNESESDLNSILDNFSTTSERTKFSKNDDSNFDPDQIRTMLHKMKDQIEIMIRMIGGEQLKINKDLAPGSLILDGGEQIIEGVFNGDKMIGSDGQEYSVAPNYASKSKLVEGDIMKLTITKQGRFIYKQIAQTERKRVVGELAQDYSTGQWNALANGKIYKLLTASVTFYRGKSGSEVIILIPESGASQWGAVENIINK